MATSLDPAVEVGKVLKKVEQTLLFTDLPDNNVIYHCKSLPAENIAEDSNRQAVNSSLSMCYDVHRTLCFTDLDEAREHLIEIRKSNLMSQVLAEESLVTPADLERFQARIEEAQKLRERKTVMDTELPDANAGEPQKEDGSFIEEESIEGILGESYAEKRYETVESADTVHGSESSSSGVDFRLLVEVSVAPSAQSNDEIAVSVDSMPEKKEVAGGLTDEEEITEELTESQTEDSSPSEEKDLKGDKFAEVVDDSALERIQATPPSSQ